MAIGFNAFKGRSRSVGIKIQGLESLQKSFDKLSNKSDSLMTKEIHRAAERIAERANRSAPVDTGKLLRSINVKKRNKIAEVKVDVKYAGFVEEGTRFMSPSPRGGYIYKHIKPSIEVMTRNIKRLITL